MPDPKTCAQRHPVGSQGYKDCVAYKGKYAKGTYAKSKRTASPKPAGNPLGRSRMARKRTY